MSDEAARGSEGLAARQVAERTLYEGRVIDLRIETIELSDGSLREREVVVHPGAVAVIALDGDEVVFVRQYRAPARRVLLEIPAGTRDRAADGTIEDPTTTARRELAEETGLRAVAWRHLGTFWTAPGFATETMDLYLASDLSPAGDVAVPAEDEHLEPVRISWQRAVAMAEQGELHDAKSIVGVLWLARLIEHGEVAVSAGDPVSYQGQE